MAYLVKSRSPGVTYNLLKDKLTFEARGAMEIKGKGKMHTFIIEGNDREKH